jgi:hypothetical protein
MPGSLVELKRRTASVPSVASAATLQYISGGQIGAGINVGAVEWHPIAISRECSHASRQEMPVKHTFNDVTRPLTTA